LILKVETVNHSIVQRAAAPTFWFRSSSGFATLVCGIGGNFGQGLAYAARKRGLPAVICASESANALEARSMRRLGAQVRLAGRDFDAAKDTP